MTPFDLHAIAQISATGIVDCLVEGTLVAALAGCLLRVTRRQSAGTRFAIWFSALVLIAALPFLGQGGSVHAGNSAIHAPVTLPRSWALYLFVGWAGIAALGLVRVGTGFCHLYMLRRTCTTIDPAILDARLRATLERYGKDRHVAFCVSDRVSVPTAIGLLQPLVVVPRWLLQELSTDELNQVLLHELAHLRRRDDWTNLFQKVVKAVFFFHPAVWWIEKKISLEREMACDDAVLADTASPRAYAECLAHLAEKTFLRRTVALAQAALGHIRQTSLRVTQILEPNRPRVPGWKPAAALVAGFTVVCALSAAKTPKLVGFEDARPLRLAAAPLSPAPPAREVYATNVSTSVDVHPAAFVSRVEKARAVPVKARRPAVVPRQDDFQAASLGDGPAPQPASASSTEGLVHLTDFHPDSSAAETVFVIVQSCEFSDSGQPVYQLSVWRVVVFHPGDGQHSVRIPRKET